MSDRAGVDEVYCYFSQDAIVTELPVNTLLHYKHAGDPCVLSNIFQSARTPS